MPVQNILIIQTAFIGDVILATPLIEKLSACYPEAAVDVLINQSNRALFHQHPKIRRVWTWDKKQQKYKNLLSLLRQVRGQRYDLLVNCHRYFSTGLITAFSGAATTIGFDKNPFSFFYTKKVSHVLEEGGHEVDRNLSLVAHLKNTDENTSYRRPVLYPSDTDSQAVRSYQEKEYLCLAPASIWFTKQFPQEKWVALIGQLPFQGSIYLLGGPDDTALCEAIRQQTDPRVENLAGKLSLLQSAALMQGAILNYVNDSAPLHLSSAVNAPVCAVYCSTVPRFGFYPLSDFSAVVEIKEDLYCRPCGSHGYKACPEGHFRCAKDITIQPLLVVFQQAWQQYTAKQF